MRYSKWYVDDFSQKKACGTTTFGKNKSKLCIFGKGTAVSPDLQLAVEKGMMIAKSNQNLLILSKVK